MRVLPILVLIGCIFLGYAWEFIPDNIQWVAPLDESKVPLSGRWWVFILAKDLCLVALAWTVWYLIPKTEKLIKLGAAALSVFITTYPVVFMVYYFPPFSGWMFLLRATTSITIGFLINYGDGFINRINSGAND